MPGLWDGRSSQIRAWVWLGAGVTLVVGTGAMGGWSYEPLPADLPSPTEQVEQEAWRAGAAELLPDRYGAFRRRLADTRTRFLAERSRWSPWQDRAQFEREFTELTQDGHSLVQATRQKREAILHEVDGMLQAQESRLARLRLTATALGMRVRHTPLSAADMALREAKRHLEGRRVERARLLIESAADRIHGAEAQALEQLTRYTDAYTVKRWNLWARATAESSRIHRGTAILVAKAERRLLLYKDGHVAGEYPIGVGFNALPDKLHGNDGATPEGKFRVMKKKGPGQTRFYKALLLDYPTPDHRRLFQEAKARGLLPRHASIGGLIEIHGRGAGDEERTNGCVSLGNEQMDALYEAVEQGTPVTIIGSLTKENPVAREAKTWHSAGAQPL